MAFGGRIRAVLDRCGVKASANRAPGQEFERRLTPSHDEIAAWIQPLLGPAAVYEGSGVRTLNWAGLP